MSYNVFDFLGTDKKKRVGGNAMSIAKSEVTESSLKELIRKSVRSKLREKAPCWKGYKQVGMKKKSGKEVPNCVPESYDVYNETTGKGMTIEFKEGELKTMKDLLPKDSPIFGLKDAQHHLMLDQPLPFIENLDRLIQELLTKSS